MQTGSHHLARRNLLFGDRLCDRDKRHQGRLGAHFDTFAVCTSRKLAGSRSNGKVPATGAKPSNAGPIELAIRSAISGVAGTPATSVIALTSLGVGFVMSFVPSRNRITLPQPLQRCGE